MASFSDTIYGPNPFNPQQKAKPLPTRTPGEMPKPTESGSNTMRDFRNLSNLAQQGMAAPPRLANTWQHQQEIDKAQKLMNRRYDHVPQVIDPGAQALSGQFDFRKRQDFLADVLTRQVEGRGPSVAEQQMRMGQDALVAQAMAMSRSGRGTNPALAARQAAFQASGAQQQMAGQAAMLRAQEQMNAQAMLGNLAAGARSQDLQYGQALIGSAQRADMANQAAYLQAQGQRDASQARLMGMDIGIDATNLGATQDYYQQQINRDLGLMGIASGTGLQQQQADMQRENRWWNLAGSLIGGAAQGAGYLMGKSGT